MTTRTIANKPVQVNDEGFMLNPAEWDKTIAFAIAQEEGVSELTSAHWQVIDFCRQRSARSPPALTSRPKNSLPSSPKARPRRLPKSPGWASRRGAFKTSTVRDLCCVLREVIEHATRITNHEKEGYL
jgi:tRNA 2-thiouridine synthesizing protein E